MLANTSNTSWHQNELEITSSIHTAHYNIWDWRDTPCTNWDSFRTSVGLHHRLTTKLARNKEYYYLPEITWFTPKKRLMQTSRSQVLQYTCPNTQNNSLDSTAVIHSINSFNKSYKFISSVLLTWSSAFSVSLFNHLFVTYLVHCCVFPTWLTLSI